MKLTIDNFKSMMNLSLANVKAREEEFSKLDAIAGDGDHGTAIVTALTIIAGDAQQGTEFPAMLNDMGMGEALEPLGVTDELNAAQVKVMFRGGLTGVEEQTKAKLGDKTMMDALVPAVVAIESCDSEDVKELLKAGAEAALKGAEATVNMKANFGRARNLGERSVGFADAGATSWACLFESFYQGLE